MRAIFVALAVAVGVLVCSSESRATMQEAVRIEVQRQIEALTAQLNAQVRELKAQNAALEKRNDMLEFQQSVASQALYEKFMTEAKVPAADLPKGNVPSYSNPPGPNIINDITCRPRLTYVGTESTGDDPARKYCNVLRPGTRLLLENLNAGITGGYTNIAGSPNLAGLNITESATTFYQVGIGYVQKPILRHIRALFDEDPNRPAAITHQNSILDDFVFNAVQMNAGVGYGRALTIRDQDRIETANNRPQYSASLSYSLDLQRVYIHLFHGGVRGQTEVRPVDAGYYYAPPNNSFWDGAAKDSAIMHGLQTPSPKPTETPSAVEP